MMVAPQMAIICENTLSSMALRGLLVDIAPNVDVVCYNSVEEFRRSEAPVAHFFISANVLFHNAEMFQPYMRRTIVMVEGEASPFIQSGFRTIDVTASEQQIVRSILKIYSMGHPSGHHPNMHGRIEESATKQLSSRERDVLALVVKGYINKEIADSLNISLTTVIFHRNNISEKLNTRSIGRLTIYAVLNNIVQISEI